jgi:hypothetical protein
MGLVRMQVDEKGWAAEFEIPFKTIDFNPAAGEMGFNVSPYKTRGREASRWASPSLDVKFNQVVKAGEITGPEGMPQGVGLDVKPFGLGGFSRDINREDVYQGTAKAGAEPPEPVALA